MSRYLPVCHNAIRKPPDNCHICSCKSTTSAIVSEQCCHEHVIFDENHLRGKKMNRFERALGILLHLRSGKEISASDLAQRLEVSRRTIYRDMDVLSTLGVPIYAERGHAGGFRLLEGY